MPLHSDGLTERCYLETSRKLAAGRLLQQPKRLRWSPAVLSRTLMDTHRILVQPSRVFTSRRYLLDGRVGFPESGVTTIQRLLTALAHITRLNDQLSDSARVCAYRL